ncbi:MAG: hypothetical protein COX43_03275 [Parcubacteria group bacterium CG23_combo_of_CG06-09_8_20_14_all_35_9]|nr:MAG: hypothetical protein COX43_03275 [Parcubacteria group bacterium CG23_combo_of_CG06-09_8_20_14_all_35_9]
MDIQEQIIKILLGKRLILETQIKDLKEESEKSGETLETLLIKDKLIDEEELTKIKGQILGVPYVDLFNKEIDASVLNIISREVAENYQMIAFDKKGEKLKIALVDPHNFKAMEAANFLAKENHLRVEYHIISPTGIENVLKKYQILGKEIKEELEVAQEKFVSEKEKEVEKEVRVEEVIKRAPVAKMVETIIRHAVQLRASDIHIEPYGEETRVRYRVDGVLHTSLSLPSYIHSAVVSRIKILANLKIDETRKPQDGRIRLTVKDKKVDLRVSTLPLIDSEKIMMRILDTSGAVVTLEKLGFGGRCLKVLQDITKRAEGMVLVTGPTGSGKSTTLYALLGLLNKERVNIVTIEDPVEYYVAGINQSQVNPQVGFTFASGLRSILRQDPNIIMVGEIRDDETAELAIHAGLTGHLVLSTLHTRDAIGAIPRLRDMKTEFFLIASTLNLIIAQRLVRKICEYCREPFHLPSLVEEEIRKELSLMPPSLISSSLDLSKPLTFFRGRGCSRCNNTGYQGRTVIIEIIKITPEMQKIIESGYKIEDVEKELKKQEMITMKQEGILKASQGITTIEEVMRATRKK